MLYVMQGFNYKDLTITNSRKSKYVGEYRDVSRHLSGCGSTMDIGSETRGWYQPDYIKSMNDMTVTPNENTAKELIISMTSLPLPPKTRKSTLWLETQESGDRSSWSIAAADMQRRRTARQKAYLITR